MKEKSCSNCGAMFLTDQLTEFDGLTLCDECLQNQTVICSHCGGRIWIDDNCIIKDYYYKPTPTFYGKGGRFFGVELEVDEGGEYDESAEAIMDIANASSEHIYCKHNGSLDSGFEIVTHPMTLEYHKNNLPWADMLEKLKRMGYLSHLASTCGLHVHVNRDSLGETLESSHVIKVVMEGKTKRKSMKLPGYASKRFMKLSLKAFNKHVSI